MRRRFETRSYMVYAYLVFLLFWFAGVILAYHYSNPDNLESIGIGTVSGVLLAAFKDMWSFMWSEASREGNGDTEKGGQGGQKER